MEASDSEDGSKTENESDDDIFADDLVGSWSLANS